MTEEFDAGPILAQSDHVPIDDEVTPEDLRAKTAPVVRALLTTALERVARGDPGEPQDEEGVTWAGLMEPEFATVDPAGTAREVHDQVRTFRFMGPGNGPTTEVDGRQVKVLRTSLRPADGIRLQCADAPLWILESAPATPSSPAPD